MAIQFSKAELDALHKMGIYTAEQLRDAYLRTRDERLGQLFIKYLNITFNARTELGLI